VSKVTRTDQLGEAPRSDRSFRSREQRLNGFMGHQINLLVRCPSIYGQSNQFLVLPGGALKDGFFQGMQGRTQLGGLAPIGSGLATPGCFHLYFCQSTDCAKFASK
jgi:hypothetical protein